MLVTCKLSCMYVFDNTAAYVLSTQLDKKYLYVYVCHVVCVRERKCVCVCIWQCSLIVCGSVPEPDNQDILYILQLLHIIFKCTPLCKINIPQILQATVLVWIMQQLPTL